MILLQASAFSACTGNPIESSGLSTHGIFTTGLRLNSAPAGEHVNWIRIRACFERPALDATVAHYLEEIDHIAGRIVKLEQAIDEAVKQSAPEIRAVIEALQASRGVAQTTAATVLSELGSLSRFQNPRQLMGYSGPGPGGKYSSGNKIQRGPITKSGNAHYAGFW
jgi:transposase